MDPRVKIQNATSNGVYFHYLELCELLPIGACGSDMARLPMCCVLSEPLGLGSDGSQLPTSLPFAEQVFGPFFFGRTDYYQLLNGAFVGPQSWHSC